MSVTAKVYTSVFDRKFKQYHEYSWTKILKKVLPLEICKHEICNQTNNVNALYTFISSVNKDINRKKYVKLKGKSSTSTFYIYYWLWRFMTYSSKRNKNLYGIPHIPGSGEIDKNNKRNIRPIFFWTFYPFSMTVQK